MDPNPRDGGRGFSLCNGALDAACVHRHYVAVG